MLADAKATLDVKNERSYTPLHVAVRRSCCGIVQVLTDAKADVDIQDNYGYRLHSLAQGRVGKMCRGKSWLSGMEKSYL